MVGLLLSPDNTAFWKAQAAYHAELLRSSRSTHSLAGCMLELLMGPSQIYSCGTHPSTLVAYRMVAHTETEAQLISQ